MSDETRMPEVEEMLQVEETGEDQLEEAEPESMPVGDPVFGEGEEADQAREELISWMDEELSDLRPDESGGGNDRAQMEQDWKEWKRASLARPESRTKNEPWPNASNVATPFMFSAVNGVTSHVKAALTEKEPRHRVKTTNPDYVDHAAAAERWLNALAMSPHHVNLPKYDDTLPYETSLFGTEVVETSWVEDRVQIKRVRDGVTEVVDKTLYSGPRPRTYRLEDVFIRQEYATFQEAPIFFLRDYYSAQELKALEYEGFFEDVERLWSAPVNEMGQVRQTEDQVMGLDTEVSDRPSPSKLYEVLKVYVRFDADRDGIIEDIIVWYSPEAQAILRTEFNVLGLRPARNLKYFDIPGQFYGIGVGHMLAPLQGEIDSLHNIRVDSLALSSLQMIVTRPGTVGLGANESLFPGKVVESEEPGDVKVFGFPDTSGGTLQAERVAREYGQTVTGISDVQLGMPDMVAKSGTSPTLQQFLSQQGNKILRSIIKNSERGYGEIMMDVFLHLVANSDKVLSSGKLLELVGPDDRELIREILMMDVEDVPLTFQFQVRSTQVDETEDAKRQMILTQMQLYMQYFQTATQIQMQMANPQLPPQLQEYLQTMFVGLTELTSNALKLFDVENADDLLPATEHIQLMVEMLKLSREPQVSQLEEMIRRMKDVGRQGPATGQEMGPFAPGLTGSVESERRASLAGREGDVGGPARGNAGGPAPGGPGGPAGGPGSVPGGSRV